MPMSAMKGGTPAPLMTDGVLHEDVELPRLVDRERLVARRVGVVHGAGRQRVERRDDRHEVQPDQRRIRLGRGPRAGLDQHHRRAPQRQVVAERPHLELVVVAADLPGRERLERVADHRADLLRERPPGAVGARLVEGHREQRDRRRLRRIADRRAPALVVQVEADARLKAVADRLQRAALRASAGRARRG